MVDWDLPIEAVHQNGCVVPTHIVEGPDRDGDYWLSDFTGKFRSTKLICWAGSRVDDRDGWTVRNVPEFTGLNIQPLPNPTPIPADIAKRMLVIISKIAVSGAGAMMLKPDTDEAREILAALEPADGDDKLASELAYKEGWRTFDTGWDSVVRVAHACLKRGRQLEKEGK